MTRRRESAARIRRFGQVCIPGAVSVAAALFATWPLLAHIGTAVPLGTEREGTVPLFNLWNLWWTANRIPHGFAAYLDAPFFYPNTGVTAYSEPMPLLGIIVSPLWGFGAPAPLIYNLALLAVLMLNGIFAYRIASALDAPRIHALAAAVLTVTLPFLLKVSGVLGTVSLFGMLWSIDGLIRFGRSGSLRWAAWSATGFVATFYTWQQYWLFFLPVVIAGSVVALNEQGFRRGALIRAGASGAVAVGLIAILAVPTLRVHHRAGFRQPEPFVAALSARARDFISRPADSVVPFPHADPADTAGLFPGLLLTGLAVAGVAVGARDRRRRAWILYLAGSSVFAVVIALGLTLEIAGWRPYATARSALPVLRELRSPYRAAALFQMFLPVLAVVALVGAASLRRRWSIAVTIFVALLAASENLALPRPLFRVASSPRTAATSWLRHYGREAVVAHIPFPGGLHVSDYEVETRRMFAQIDHGKPLINGYSGYFPTTRDRSGRVVPAYALFQLVMARDFPRERLLCVLHGLGATIVAVDRPWFAEHRQRLAKFSAFLTPAYADETVKMYYLRVPKGHCPGIP